MYNFSIEISDHIAEDFEQKLQTSSDLGINNIEISDTINLKKSCETNDRDPINGKKLYEMTGSETISSKKLYQMTGSETEVIRDLLIDHGKRIVLLSTDLDVNDKENLNLLFRKALTLNVKGIKITPAEGADLSYISKLSKSYRIPLLLENKANTYMDNEKTMLELVAKAGNASVIFNPFEYLCTDKHPFFHVYYASKIKNYISFLRITDGLFTAKTPIMLYHGGAEVKELASIMLSRSFDGYFSFTPYLQDMSLEQYREVIGTFKKQLKNM